MRDTNLIDSRFRETLGHSVKAEINRVKTAVRKEWVPKRNGKFTIPAMFEIFT